MHDYLWVAILGFGVNIVAIIVAIIAGINKKLITSIVNPIIKLLGKIHIFKQPDKVIDNFDKSMDNFSGQFKVMKSEKLMVLKMFVVAVIQSMSYYSITYMVYKAFGNSEITFLPNNSGTSIFIINYDFCTYTWFRPWSRRWILFIV